VGFSRIGARTLFLLLGSLILLLRFFTFLFGPLDIVGETHVCLGWYFTSFFFFHAVSYNIFSIFTYYYCSFPTHFYLLLYFLLTCSTSSLNLLHSLRPIIVFVDSSFFLLGVSFSFLRIGALGRFHSVNNITDLTVFSSQNDTSSRNSEKYSFYSNINSVYIIFC
jgi:hypothetical protein